MNSLKIDFNAFALSNLKNLSEIDREDRLIELQKYHEAKFKLGASAWNEWQDEINHFINNFNHNLLNPDGTKYASGKYQPSDFRVKLYDLQVDTLENYKFTLPTVLNCIEVEKDTSIHIVDNHHSLWLSHVNFKGKVSFYGDLCDIYFSNEIIFNKDVEFHYNQRSDSAIKFGECHFKGSVLFTPNSTHTAPSQSNEAGLRANFLRAKFEKNITFKCVDFDYVRFFETVLPSEDGSLILFENVKFNTALEFSRKIINCKVKFLDVIFTEDANFNSAIFNKNVIFTRVIFEKNAYFNQSQDTSGSYGFNKKATFNKCTFKKRAYFRHRIFNGKASFELSDINTLVLDGAVFKNQVPDFRYTKMTIPPSLSQIQLPENLDKGKFNIERYKKMKSMAIEANNHDEEIKLFSLELDAKFDELKNIARDKIEKNAIKRKAICPLEQLIEYLKISPYFIYKHFSNYGQSIFRPLLILLAFWFILGSFTYLLTPLNESSFNTTSIEKSAKITKELHLNTSYDCRSMRHFEYSMHFSAQALTPIQLGTDQEREKVVFCLFDDEVPNGAIKFVEVIMKSFGIILFFLLGISIRNRFKIR